MAAQALDGHRQGDGSCGITFSLGSRILALAVTLGGLLAVIGIAAWLLATSPAINAASVLAFGCLIVLVLAAAATIVIRPRDL